MIEYSLIESRSLYIIPDRCYSCSAQVQLSHPEKIAQLYAKSNQNGALFKMLTPEKGLEDVVDESSRSLTMKFSDLVALPDRLYSQLKELLVTRQVRQAILFMQQDEGHYFLAGAMMRAAKKIGIKLRCYSLKGEDAESIRGEADETKPQ